MRAFPGLLLSAALAGCASVDAGMRGVWPDYRGAIRVVRDGREDPEPLRVAGERSDFPWNEVMIEYRDSGSLVVLERIRASRDRGWSRILTVEGLASGFDAFVRVPHQDAAGNALELVVHGEPVRREPGRLETEIPLSRDGPVEIVLRRAE